MHSPSIRNRAELHVLRCPVKKPTAHGNSRSAGTQAKATQQKPGAAFLPACTYTSQATARRFSCYSSGRGVICANHSPTSHLFATSGGSFNRGFRALIGKICRHKIYLHCWGSKPDPHCEDDTRLCYESRPPGRPAAPSSLAWGRHRCPSRGPIMRLHLEIKPR